MSKLPFILAQTLVNCQVAKLLTSSYNIRIRVQPWTTEELSSREVPLHIIIAEMQKTEYLNMMLCFLMFYAAKVIAT